MREDASVHTGLSQKAKTDLSQTDRERAYVEERIMIQTLGGSDGAPE
jgi:hypothetical protein